MSTSQLKVAKAAPVPSSRVDLLGIACVCFGLAIAFAAIGFLTGCGSEETGTNEPVVGDTSQTNDGQVEGKKITTTTEHVANIVFRKSSDVVEKCDWSTTCTADVAINVTYSITAGGVEGVLYYNVSQSVTEDDAMEVALNLPWGIAPDDLYTNKSGEKIDVTSYLNDAGKAEIMMGAVWAISNKKALNAQYETGNRLEGSVSENGKTINWTIYSSDGQIIDSDELTL